MPDQDQPLASTGHPPKRPRHPGMTDREYLIHCRQRQRWLSWGLVIAGGVSLLVTLAIVAASR
jgi:hypothetical protein